eukprot:TRINITY_DN879_c0_g1_i1.p1 TRINITY_DN879_c0_g1~~TRINITY_DN879_c0_g1_i1.p1  ORF type:complete len:336 (+),score=30.71 TRINITY_DN879_c0_g1_i1:1-1008(+)
MIYQKRIVILLPIILVFDEEIQHLIVVELLAMSGRQQIQFSNPKSSALESKMDMSLEQIIAARKKEGPNNNKKQSKKQNQRNPVKPGNIPMQQKNFNKPNRQLFSPKNQIFKKNNKGRVGGAGVFQRKNMSNPIVSNVQKKFQAQRSFGARNVQQKQQQGGQFTKGGGQNPGYVLQVVKKVATGIGSAPKNRPRFTPNRPQQQVKQFPQQQQFNRGVPQTAKNRKFRNARVDPLRQISQRKSMKRTMNAGSRNFNRTNNNNNNSGNSQTKFQVVVGSQDRYKNAFKFNQSSSRADKQRLGNAGGVQDYRPYKQALSQIGDGRGNRRSNKYGVLLP